MISSTNQHSLQVKRIAGRVLFLIALCAALATWASAAALAAAADAKPNVLFIAVDDLRPQLGCYGDPVVKTPNIDRLAKRGLRFDRAYCQQALCAPSRVSLLTGQYCASTGIYTIGPTLRSKQPKALTLPQHFKNNGWFTQSLGKIFHAGLDDPKSWSAPSWQPRKPRYGPKGQRLVDAAIMERRKAGRKDAAFGRDKSFYAGPAFEAPEWDDANLADGDTAREAVARLQQLAANPEQPFWLGVGFLNPHVPWVAPKKYWDLYTAEQIKLPDNRYPPRGAPPFAAQTGTDFGWYGNVPDDLKISDDLAHQCLHGYLAAISYTDACVGKVLDELDRLDLWKNTIVVFWGDHGYYMGEHNWFGGKHNNYEGATRVPLIVVAPEMTAGGQHTTALVESIDVFPTLVELAGLPTPETLEGQSLVPLLNDPSQPGKQAAFSEYLRGDKLGVAMRTERYRYVEWKDGSGKRIAVELYDHETDPQENQNIADAADKQLLDQLEQQMATLWKHH